MKKIDFLLDSINESQNITVDGACNAITFKNNCNNNPAVNILQINGYNLREGEFLTMSGNEGEIIKTVFSVIISGAGASQDYQIIQKIYS
jgi:hypothetical protein